MANVHVNPDIVGGSDDGTTYADAYDGLDKALLTWGIGDVIFCQNSETITATINDDTLTSYTLGTYNFIVAINNDESVDPWDDVDGSIYSIDGTSTVSICMDKVAATNFRHIINLECKNSTLYGWDASGSAEGVVYQGCVARSNTNVGWYAATAGNQWNVYLQCKMINGSSIGNYLPYGSTLVLCLSTGDSQFCLPNSYTMMIGCVGASCTGASCVAVNIGNSTLWCTFDSNNAIGLNFGSAQDDCFAGLCRFTNNGTYAVSGDTNARGMIMMNAYYSNTSGNLNGTGNYVIDLGQNVLMSGDGYTGASDYTLTDSAEARRTATVIGEYSG